MGSATHAAGGSWDDSTFAGRLAAALGHHANELLVVSICAAVALRIRPLPPLLGLALALALFGLVLTTWLLMRQHDRRLCETCMASMPLNVAEQANRHKRRFWLAHTGSKPRYLVPYLVVLLGSNLVIEQIGRIPWAVIQLSMIYLVLAYTSHRRFQPWCPWCSGGGGGQEVDETPPVLPHDDRQLV